MLLTSRSLRRGALALATLGVLAACDDGQQMSAPVAQSSQPTLALAVSTANSQGGSRIAISLENLSDAPIGSVQGYLRFDPTALAYVGQHRDAAQSDIMLVNDTEAQNGELRLSALNTQNIDRSAMLLFDVLGGDYTSGLSFEIEETILNGSPIKAVDARMAERVIVDPSLDAASDAARLTVQDWIDLLDPEVAAAGGPGFVFNGLRFGDTNFSNSITTADGLYLINISIGLAEAIIGTDGTGATGERDAAVAGNVFPFNTPGLGEPGDVPPGLNTDGTRTITTADGLAAINEFIGVLQPVVGEVIPGRPASPTTNRAVITSDITTNTTWSSDTIYELVGGISVTGATLTIEAGTRVEGRQGVGGSNGGALFIARDAMIEAEGTALQPIIFTCSENAGEPARAKGCWGGVTLLGNASLNDGTLTSPVIPGRAASGGCAEKEAEGAAGLYGGCNDDDNSGTIRYARIEYAGFRFNAEDELNGLALNGVGRGTTIDFVQVHATLDDCIEQFGGTVNLKHLVLTACSDDAFDYTEGWTADAQFIIVQADSLDSDHAFENDNFGNGNDNLPRARPTIYNVTVIGKADATAAGGNTADGGLLVREGARPTYRNFVVKNYPWGLDIDQAASTCVDIQTPAGFTLENSIFDGNIVAGISDSDQCPGLTETAFITSSPGNVIGSAGILSPFDVTVPDFRPAFGSAGGGATPPSGGFFDATATFIGAVPPATVTKNNIPWYAGWTRGWTTPTQP